MAEDEAQIERQRLWAPPKRPEVQGIIFAWFSFPSIWECLKYFPIRISG